MARNKIEQIVLDHFEVSLTDIKSGKRLKVFSEPRHIIWALTKYYRSGTPTTIGKTYNRHRKTVQQGLAKVNGLLTYDKDYRETFESFVAKLNHFESR